ncbi:MAG TPA: DUF445 domain-containing protein [Gammaproteobacteria bacterium]|jgi:uncharacterized membrane-anchored protein YjiN (DUF445 family)|nr:DUF445 domain-containing protein [Gammaproteobacteria bacterium]
MTLEAPDKLDRLRRTKLAATALLVVMAGVFAVSYTFRSHYPWLRFVEAFAEAALVGGLADWFAVTALFRHPLGLPIPHTAILVRRKDAIGAALARFVEENFLTRDAVQAKLASLDFVRHGAVWLKRDDNLHRVSTSAAALASGMGRIFDARGVRAWLADNLKTGLARVDFAPLAGRLLDLVTRDNHHQRLLDAAVRIGRDVLEENRAAIRDRIDEKSPWWMPKFVDENIYRKLMDELERTLDNIGADASHPARERFNRAVREFIEDLKHDPEYRARGEAFKQEIVQHPELEAFLGRMSRQIGQIVGRELRDPDSPLYAQLESNLNQLAATLLRKPALRDELNGWIAAAVLFIVEQYRHEIGALISETVKSWDAKPTARRIELEVGRDLQFIRVNGTIVGGLAGLVIYSLSMWLGNGF